MTPRPPAWAMAMARRASVTVSMAAEMMGIESGIVRVMRVAVETSAGSTEDAPGFISTSSKVRYSGIGRGIGQPFNAAGFAWLAAVLNTPLGKRARAIAGAFRPSRPLPLAPELPDEIGE